MKRPLSPSQHKAFAELAKQIEGIDEAVYQAFDRDSLEPIIGLGPADAPLRSLGVIRGVRKCATVSPSSVVVGSWCGAGFIGISTAQTCRISRPAAAWVKGFLDQHGALQTAR